MCFFFKVDFSKALRLTNLDNMSSEDTENFHYASVHKQIEALQLRPVLTIYTYIYFFFALKYEQR